MAAREHAFVRYLRTMWAYLGRGPRKFFEQRELAQDRYSRPLNFLFANAALAAIVTAIAVPPPDFSSGRLEIAVAAAAGTLSNIVAVIFGLVAAWILVQRVRLRPMLAAFCYAGAWLPLYVPATVKAFSLAETNQEGRVVFGAAMLAQGLYLAYLISGLARVNYIAGRVMRSFVVLTSVLVLALGTAVGFWFLKLQDEEKAWNAPFAWNSLSNDLATLRATNVSDNPSCEKNCWSTDVSAVTGDVIAFTLYYHHPSPRPARDVRLKLLLPKAIDETGIVGGEVWSADESRRSGGSVRVRVKADEPITLRLLDGYWYSGDDVRPLPANAAVKDVLRDEGFRLGDVASGWDYHGDLVVRFAVVNIHGKAPLANPERLTGRAICTNRKPQIVLTWDEVQAASRIMVLRDGRFVATADQNMWVDASVEARTSYSYAVRACDGARCIEELSSRIEVRAVQCND